MVMIYEGRAGEHVTMSAENAIELSARYNRKVRMRFNGVSVAVNKRLSVKHVVGTWHRMVDARCQRYSKSPEAIFTKSARKAEIDSNQSGIDALMSSFPQTKEDAAAWLAKWIPLSDDIGVDRYAAAVIAGLNQLGFVANQHVGDEELGDGTASGIKKIEYIAGQAISMLESVGCVHPMLCDWAEDAAKSLSREGAEPEVQRAAERQ